MLINQSVNYNIVADPLSAIFAALSDPTRRAILRRLSFGDATINELAEPFTMSLPAISKHIKVLERAGLVARGRNAQWRPCRIQGSTLKEVAAWVNEYRNFWDDHMDNLDLFIQKHPAVATNKNKGKK